MDKRTRAALDAARAVAKKEYPDTDIGFIRDALKEGFRAGEIIRAGRTLGHFEGRNDKAVQKKVAFEIQKQEAKG